MTIAALLCLTYLAAIAGAEVVTVVVAPLGGILFYFAILFSLIFYSAKGGEYPPNRLFLALGLAPLIRIVNLSMPLAQFSQIYSYLLVSIPLVAGILMVVTALRLNPSVIGLRVERIPIQVAVGLTGVGFGLADYFILKPEPLIFSLRFQEIIVPSFILLLTTGFLEELAFRGVMQRVLAEILGSWGWICIALLYTVLQIGHHSAMHCLLTLVVATLFGWVVKRTGSILGVSLSHGLSNIVLYLVFPFVFS